MTPQPPAGEPMLRWSIVGSCVGSGEVVAQVVEGSPGGASEMYRRAAVSTVRVVKAMNEITAGDVCRRCGAAVRRPSGPDGSLEGGVEIMPTRSVTDGSLEAGVDIAPAWECDCPDQEGPQVSHR